MMKIKMETLKASFIHLSKLRGVMERIHTHVMKVFINKSFNYFVHLGCKLSMRCKCIYIECGRFVESTDEKFLAAHNSLCIPIFCAPIGNHSYIWMLYDDVKCPKFAI